MIFNRWVPPNLYRYCAILLGRLGLTPAEAIAELIITARHIYPEGDVGIVTIESRTVRLREAIGALLLRKGLRIDEPFEDQTFSSGRCKV